jgi:transcriptional regulator with XRE-family HTH domain
MEQKIIIEKVKMAVKESGYTQAEFEKKFGLANSLISRWAMGISKPSVKSLKKIAEATNKPLEYFLSDGGDFYVGGDIKGSANIGNNNHGTVIKNSENDNKAMLDRLQKIELKMDKIDKIDTLDLKLDLILEKMKNKK